MSYLGVILAMSAGVFALRLGGMALPEFRMPDALQRALNFVPVALLGALVASTLGSRDGDGAAGYVAVLAGGIAAYLTRRMWACILAGLGCYWLLQVAGLA